MMKTSSAPSLSDDTKNESRLEARRAQILEAAYGVFAKKGFSDTTVADIARVLGIGHGTFYRYFENKHHVFEEVLNQALLRVAKTIESEPADASNSLAEYRAQVERIGGRMLDLLDEDPTVQRLLFYEAMGISADLDEKIQQVWELTGVVTEAYLSNGKAKGFLRADLDVKVTALAINALIFEGGRRVVRSADRVEARARFLAGLCGLIFDGISAR